ncbi:MAG: ferric reductase-like transmembrane domain-containing protein [Acidimicrobiales bacterium]
MTEQLWWYVARSGGIVALLLSAASVIWGLLLASGFLDRNPPKRWLLSLHSWLGGLTVSFTAIHLLGLWLDGFIEYSIVDLFVPFASTEAPGAWPMAWGIIAFYLLVAVQATSLMMKRIPRRWWRAIHMSSFAVLGTGIVHGATAGTDSTNPAYLVGVILVGLSTVFLTTYRVLMRRTTPHAKSPALAKT